MTLPHRQRHIVLVEDDPDDQRLVEQALAERGLSDALTVLSSGHALITHLQEEESLTYHARYPDLVLLNLDLEGPSGLEVLANMKTHPGWRLIPVVAFTDATSDEDVGLCYDCGVNAYIIKPATYQEMRRVMQVLESFWFRLVQLPSRSVNVGPN